MRTLPNNFDFVRLIAALAVVVSHQTKLTGHGKLMVSADHDLGKIGVMAFFALSGYLVAQSWERDPQLWRFLTRRALRIWPGLVCVVLLTVFVLGPAVTTWSLAEYFAAPQTWQYLGHLVLIISERLPGVFEGQTIERVNGPLWTIPVEVGWYVALAALGLGGVLRRRWALLGLLLAVAVYVFGIYGAEDEEPIWTLELGLFFLYGSCLHHFRGLWMPRRGLMALVAVGLALLWNALGHQYVAILSALPYFVIVVGQASTPVLRDVGRWGDFSYGIYIYSFPLQQTVIWLTANALGLVEGTVLCLGLTLLFAATSWHLVEKPALALKPRRGQGGGVASSPTPYPADGLPVSE